MAIYRHTVGIACNSTSSGYVGGKYIVSNRNISHNSLTNFTADEEIDNVFNNLFRESGMLVVANIRRLQV